MEEIHVQLFGVPTIKYKGDIITFSLKKAEALFYYLVVKQKFHRDEVINLLWNDMTQQKARKNLRNALYKVRNMFKIDIGITTKGDIVELSNSNIVNISLTEDILYSYKGEFMESFYVKNAPEFNEWVSKNRRYYKDMYLAKLLSHIKELYNQKDYDNAIIKATKYLEEDIFDERVCRLLMNIYVDNGTPNKALHLYKDLERKLDLEIGVCPDDDTREIYSSIVNRPTMQKADASEFFYGREDELKKLELQYKMLKKDKRTRAVFIKGEVGIGKTKFKDYFFSNKKQDNIHRIEINCSKIEENCPLRPFATLIEKITALKDNSANYLDKNIVKHLLPALKDDISYKADINYNFIENSIIDMFKKLSVHNKIILVLENFQWIDDISLNLLARLLYNIKDNLMIVGLLRDDYKESIQSFIMNIKDLNIYNEITISRLDEYECGEFVKMGLANFKLSKQTIHNIYTETEGNTCFLIEVINTLRHNGEVNVLTAKMKDILQGRIMQVTKDGRMLLNIMSLFSEVIPLNIISKISSVDEIDILTVTDELQRRLLIKEDIQKNDVVYCFTHIKLKEFLYMNLTHTKKIILHNKIAQVLKAELSNYKQNIDIYPKIIYHFEKANNIESALKYTMEYADLRLSFNHELFPNLYESNMQMDRLLYAQSNNIHKLLDSIKILIKRCEEEKGYVKDIKKYKLEYIYMLGRYNIREANYEQGLRYVQDVIKKATNLDEDKFKIKSFKQLIYYSIQTHDIDTMNKYLDLLADCISDDINKAIYMRLKGLNHIMQYKYDDAQSMLQKSIDILSGIDEDNPTILLNIAASYNYIGDIKRYRYEFDYALKYYNKAIDICKKLRALKGLTIFYTNVALTCYEMKDYNKAKEYLLKGNEIFEISGAIWKRSVHQGLLSLIYAHEKQIKSSLESYKKAKEYCNKIKNPLESKWLLEVEKELVKLSIL
ncbi:AAA family ATPase [Clostridiaceae bacterium M8S5]|nr:AAA family ATPase [Clostridiaceae bacterium M8S5]